MRASLGYVQYEGDLLLAVKSKKDCLKATQELLRTLSQLGFQVSKRKAQICTS